MITEFFSRRTAIRMLGLGLAALLSTLARPAQAADAYEAHVYTNAAGLTLPYRLLVPQAYNPAHAYPLVIFFHGAGERGDDNTAQLKHGTSLFLKPKVRRRFPCFVFAPQCPRGQQWVNMPWGDTVGTQPKHPSTSMRLALDVVNALPKEFNIDTNRLYVTGLSMGGYAAWDCLTRFPGRFAAVVPICGGGDERTVTRAVARTPVWAFQSTDDPVVPIVRTRHMIDALVAKGGHPHFFEYTGLGHDSWDRAYAEPELLPWMFAQRRGQLDTYHLKTLAPVPPSIAKFPPDSAFPGKGPIRRAAWFQRVWIQRRSAWWRHRAYDHGAVVFLGDSITQGWRDLAKAFPHLHVANRGISGDITRGVLLRLQVDVFQLDPKAIVLLIGTNDLEDNGTPETIAQNVHTILNECHAFNPKMPVIVCKVMPSSPSKNRPAAKIERLNALVDAFVKGNPQFIRCDTWSIYANANGNATRDEFPDLLHPNAAGYAKWAQALRPIFARLDLGN